MKSSDCHGRPRHIPVAARLPLLRPRCPAAESPAPRRETPRRYIVQYIVYLLET